MTSSTFDVNQIRQAFPALSSEKSGVKCVYLDNAATTQKPLPVIQYLTDFYSGITANVHRGSHQATLSRTQLFEDARKKVADFLHADVNGIIWTKGTTESINLVAYSFALHQLGEGDEILISEMEHHANIVPWQLIAEMTGAKIIKLPIHVDTCTLDMSAFDKLLNERTKIVAVSHISNVTGTRHPIEDIITKAHNAGALVIIDGAQAVTHERIDLKTLNADFYAFSGHKCFSPEGIGVLYVNPIHLPDMQPWQGGGKSIKHVSFESTEFQDNAGKFEAGTPNIAGAGALSKAIEWFKNIDLQGANSHISALQKKLISALQQFRNIHVLPTNNKTGIVSFYIDDIHHSDIATLLDQQGVAIRFGYHCAHPLMNALGINGCVRISISVYNTEDDINICIQSIQKAVELL